MAHHERGHNTRATTATADAPPRNARRESANKAFYARRKSAGLGTRNDDARSQRRSRRPCQHPRGQQGVFVCLVQDALLTSLRRCNTDGDVSGGFCLVMRRGDRPCGRQPFYGTWTCGRTTGNCTRPRYLATHSQGRTHKAEPYTSKARYLSAGPAKSVRRVHTTHARRRYTRRQAVGRGRWKPRRAGVLGGGRERSLVDVVRRRIEPGYWN